MALSATATACVSWVWCESVWVLWVFVGVYNVVVDVWEYLLLLGRYDVVFG